LTRIYIPKVVVQTSPFVGDVGATPCGTLNDEPDVVDVGEIIVPEKVPVPPTDKSVPLNVRFDDPDAILLVSL
jgi:hypothetical protein